jgi:hypothetical protein
MVQNATAGTSTPNHSALRRPINVKFTTHALHTLDVRGIKMMEVLRALENDLVVKVRTDKKTVNTIYTTSNFEIVTRDNNNYLFVVTVINTDELNK